MDGFIQRVDWAEDGARVRLHQIDLRQIPAGIAQGVKDNPRTEVRDRCLTTLRSVGMPLQRRRAHSIDTGLEITELLPALTRKGANNVAVHSGSQSLPKTWTSMSHGHSKEKVCSGSPVSSAASSQALLQVVADISRR